MSGRVQGWLIRGVVTVALGIMVALGWTERERFTPVEARRRAPAYAAPSLTGDTVSLEALRGRVVLLNIWATWCPPCRWEMPALERLHRELHDEGLEVVAVSVDAAPGELDFVGKPGGDVRALVRDLGLTFTILLDPQGEVQRRYGVVGLPTTFLVGRDGRVVERVLGPARWDEPPHADRIRELLES